jgi:hypothetical protein
MVGILLLQKNHLSGLCRTYLKVNFDIVQDLTHVKSDLLPVVERNQVNLKQVRPMNHSFLGRGNLLFREHCFHKLWELFLLLRWYFMVSVSLKYA